MFPKVDFMVVQDYRMTPTAMQADLVLPASFPVEIGGTFTNAQKVIQEFQPALKSGPELNSLQQLNGLLGEFGLGSSDNPAELLMEIISLLPQGKDHGKFVMETTRGDNDKRIFRFGCDALVKMYHRE